METQAAQEKKLVNPPKTETKMVAPDPSKTKMVRIVALKEFSLESPSTDNMMVNRTQFVKPGQVVEVTKAQAKDLCKKLEGPYSFSGERFNADGDTKKHDCSRARLATQADINPVAHEELDSLD